MGDYIAIKGTVIVYSFVGCSQCMKAKRILNQKRIPYTDISLDSFPQNHREMTERTGGDPTVPQIFFNKIHIGGVEELEELIHERNEWETLVDMLRTEESEGGPSLPSPDTAVDIIDENANTPANDNFLWVPDEYTKLVGDMKKANLIKDNRVGLIKIYKNSFKGEEFVEWIMKERNIKKPEALEIGQGLIDRHFGQQTSKEMGETFSPDRYYQLVEDDENKPLNTGLPSVEKIITAAEYNDNLVRIIQPIYDDILCEEKRTIQYHKLVDNDEFNRYLVYCRDLSRVDLTSSSVDDRLALLINVYNMMMIHITQKMGPPVGVWARRKVFNSTYYTIGGHNYSLNSIMNGILRGNRKGNGYLWKPFGKHDLRLPLVIRDGEPLIFFGLNNGTRHAPPLRAYSTKKVREQLLEQARYMLNLDEWLRPDQKKNILYLTKMFKWHAEDFGETTEKIVEWIVEALQDSHTEKARLVKKMFYTGEYTIDYQHYDWSFNGIEQRVPSRIRMDVRISDLLRSPRTPHTPSSADGKSSPTSFAFESSYRM